MVVSFPDRTHSEPVGTLDRNTLDENGEPFLSDAIHSYWVIFGTRRLHDSGFHVSIGSRRGVDVVRHTNIGNTAVYHGKVCRITGGTWYECSVEEFVEFIK